MKESDVFSFAILAWELLTRKQAWTSQKGPAGRSYDGIRDRIARGDRPPVREVTHQGAPEAMDRLRKLLGRSWADSWGQRPSMAAIVEELRAVHNTVLHGVEAFRLRHGNCVVYRVLHVFDVTRVSQGQPIVAMDARSNMTLVEHVRNGSNPRRRTQSGSAQLSPFISTTRSFSWAVFYASSLQGTRGTNCSSCDRGRTLVPSSTGTATPSHIIVALDLSKLPDTDWQHVHDVSLPHFAAAQGLETVAHNFAVDAQEVLLRCAVPTSLITDTYRVRGEQIASFQEQRDHAGDNKKLPVIVDAHGQSLKYSPIWLKHFTRKFEGHMDKVRELLRIPSTVPASSAPSTLHPRAAPSQPTPRSTPSAPVAPAARPLAAARSVRPRPPSSDDEKDEDDNTPVFRRFRAT